MRRHRLTGARADPVERFEEPIDVVAVAVYVRRHADAPFATPDQHPQAGELTPGHSAQQQRGPEPGYHPGAGPARCTPAH